jgi:hypothetical protein
LDDVTGVGINKFVATGSDADTSGVPLNESYDFVNVSKWELVSL